MDYEDKKVSGKHNEAVWIVGVLCGIVLVVLFIFSACRGTELSRANEKIESLAQENKALTDENKELHQQIEELQKKYDKAQEEAESAKEKADAYDDVQDQVERFSKGLQELFSYPETEQEG